MSVATVMSAWVAYLGASPFTLTVYKRMPALPYAGVYPFGVITPGTQRAGPIAGGGLGLGAGGGAIQQGGFYHLFYVDQLGATYTSMDGVEAAAAAFADLLWATLGSTVADRQLKSTGVIAWAGEGQGVIADYDAAQWTRDQFDQPTYILPILVDVLEQPTLGI